MDKVNQNVVVLLSVFASTTRQSIKKQRTQISIVLLQLLGMHLFLHNFINVYRYEYEVRIIGSLWQSILCSNETVRLWYEYSIPRGHVK